MQVSERIPRVSEVEAALLRLTGEIKQVPPVYSAIKINGREAYKRVRAGEQVEIPARQVTVYENRLIKYEYPQLEIETQVSSGTYIRTLAEDVGKILGTGAYLTGLVRTEVGKYRLEDAVALEGASPELVKASLLDI